MKHSIARTATTGFIAGLLLLVAVSGVSYRAVSGLAELVEFRRHASLVLLGLGNIETRVNEVETNARGFLLGGDSSYLEAYDQAASMVTNEIQAVRALVKEEPAQAERIDALQRRVEARLVHMDATVASRREHGLEGALQRMKTGEGRLLMNKVRAIIVDTQRVAEAQYTERSTAVEQAARRAKMVIVIGNLLAIAVVILATRAVRHEVAARAKSESRYRDLFEESQDAIYTHDLGGKLTSFNAAAERLTGYSREEAYQMKVDRFLPADELAVIREASILPLRSGERRPTSDRVTEGEITARDGRCLTVEVKSHVRFDGERAVEVQSIARDVSERKTHELERLERMRELDESNKVKTFFAATMAHELKNIFSIIVGFSDLLQESPRLDDDEREITKLMQARAWEGSEVIRVTLEMSRSEVAPFAVEDFERINVKAFLDELQRETIAPRDGVQIVWDTAAPLPDIQGDPIKLKMVLQNLLTNALKFTDMGEVRLRADVDRGVLRFVVSDTGRGIPPEQIETLFDPFRQAHGVASRRAGGVGLGLFIVARLVKMLGGSISVESTPGSGTSFTLCVPTSTGGTA